MFCYCYVRDLGRTWPANVRTTGGSLIITSATESNSGPYLCYGSNSRGSTREQVNISVKSRSTDIVIGDLPSEVAAPLNEKIEIKCSVGGYCCCLSVTFLRVYLLYL